MRRFYFSGDKTMTFSRAMIRKSVEIGSVAQAFRCLSPEPVKENKTVGGCNWRATSCVLEPKHTAAAGEITCGCRDALPAAEPVVQWTEIRPTARLEHMAESATIQIMLSPPNVKRQQISRTQPDASCDASALFGYVRAVPEYRS
jgi:hypothetical protein